MVKIKTKKQFTLPQLIEWAWDNIDEVQNETFISDVSDLFGNYSTVQFSVDGYGFKTDGVSHDDTFTLEFEEEITEDTKLDLIERFIGGTGSVCYTSHGMSINKSLRTAPSDITITHFYIENDDRELILIWRDGKMVKER